MQLFVLMLIMGLLVADEAGPAAGALDGWRLALASVLPYALPVVLAWGACRMGLRTMRRRPERAGRALMRANMVISFARLLVVALFFFTLFGLGWLTWLEGKLGELIIVNHLLALVPPLAAAVAMWAAWYPIERRLREQGMIRQIDAGEPVHAMPSRGAYVVEQVRHHLLLMLVPMLAILAWVQTMEAVLPSSTLHSAPGTLLIIAGAVGVFAFAPLMIRVIWNTAPMPAGPLRQRLLNLCHRHAVRVRELLLWRTSSGMVNGAVMGLVGHLRYILLTDGLIERLSDRQVEAVMAHELGHVRRRHMPWLAVCALGTLGAATTLIDLLVRGVAMTGLIEPLRQSLLMADPARASASENLVMAGLLGVGLLGWGVAFGYVSRRFERQADTFAVQHLAEKRVDAEGGPAVIDEASVEAMAGALRSVAELNAVPAGRRSWRHGSIQWRVDYLRSLIGTPIDRCPIDQRVRLIQWGCAVLLAASALVQMGW